MMNATKVKIVCPSFLRPAFIRHYNQQHYHVRSVEYRCRRRSYHSTWALNIENKPQEAAPKYDCFSRARRQFIVTTSDPSTTEHEDILSQISQLFNKSNVPFELPSCKAIVILATPSLTTWLENDIFISEILHSVVGFEGQGHRDVNALLAVVDGLPSGPSSINSMHMTAEGFAFLLCDDEESLPGFWQPYEPNLRRDQNQKSSLTFRIPALSESMILQSPKTNPSTIYADLPLTNTMFRNGRTSTLLATKWRIPPRSSLPFEKTLQVEKTSQSICLPNDIHSSSYEFRIPLKSLTRPRRIVTGLGNIVRQVAGREGTPVPASQELEAAIDVYLRTAEIEKHAVTVWALVSPEECNLSRKGCNEKDMGVWLMEHGASLHRVLSGGGGWGSKMGLLSLDPDDTLPKAIDAKYDFSQSDSADNDQFQALGNIARPGFWIQFLTSQNQTQRIRNHPDNLGLATYLTLDCIPSSIDNMSQEKSYPPGKSDRPTIQIFRRFGAQSETGVYIRSTNSEGPGNQFPVIRTKVDVPYARILWKFNYRS